MTETEGGPPGPQDPVEDYVVSSPGILPGRVGPPIDPVREVLKQPIFTRSRIKQGAKQAEFFTGAAGCWSEELKRVLLENDTNQDVRGCLPTSCELAVSRIDVRFFTESIELLDYVNDLRVLFMVGSKEYLVVPVWMMPSALFDVDAGTTHMLERLIKDLGQGPLTVRALQWRRFSMDRLSIRIPSRCAFRVEIQSRNPFPEDLEIGVSLGDTYARGIM